MKTIISFFATVLFSANAFTQTSVEVTCRAQAKEVALQTYSSCVTEARNNKVEEIRKNYQKELADLKSKYDRELKKMGAGKAQNTSQAASQPGKVTKGIAKQLPSKTPTSGETASVRNVSEGTKVVAVGASEPTEGLEKEAHDADQPEFVEMPVE